MKGTILAGGSAAATATEPPMGATAATEPSMGPSAAATESSRRARESGLGRHRGASPVFRNSAQKMPKQRMPLNRFVLVRIYEDMV